MPIFKYVFSGLKAYWSFWIMVLFVLLSFIFFYHGVCNASDVITFGEIGSNIRSIEKKLLALCFDLCLVTGIFCVVYGLIKIAQDKQESKDISGKLFIFIIGCLLLSVSALWVAGSKTIFNDPKAYEKVLEEKYNE